MVMVMMVEVVVMVEVVTAVMVMIVGTVGRNTLLKCCDVALTTVKRVVI